MCASTKTSYAASTAMLLPMFRRLLTSLLHFGSRPYQLGGWVFSSALGRVTGLLFHFNVGRLCFCGSRRRGRVLDSSKTLNNYQAFT